MIDRGLVARAGCDDPSDSCDYSRVAIGSLRKLDPILEAAALYHVIDGDETITRVVEVTVSHRLVRPVMHPKQVRSPPPVKLVSSSISPSVLRFNQVGGCCWRKNGAGEPMQMPSSRWWWDLSTREFAELDMASIVAVLPVGAVEQHGPHLPVRVDAAINAGIVARAVDLLEPDQRVLVLPALPIGKSNEHLAYPGTLTLPYDVLARVWFEVAKSAWRAGIRKLILWNSHGGQPQVMEIVCRELRVELGMFAVGASWFRTVDSSDLYSAEERRHGIHGGESETSIMLHLHPDLVQMSHAADFEPRSVALESMSPMLSPEGGVGYGWQAQDLHPAGVAGNAAAADPERGHQELERAAEALVRLIGEVAAYPLEAVTAQTAFDHEGGPR